METNNEPVAKAVDQFAEYKANKAAIAAGAPTTPVEKQAPPVPQGGTAGESGAPKQETQEKPEKRAATAEERAAELRAAGRSKEADKILSDAADKREFESWRAGKADRDRDADELRQLRARPAAVATAPPAEVLPAAQSPADGPPQLTEMLKRPENKDKAYETVMEEWEEARANWRDARRKAEEQRGKLTQSFDAKVLAARAQYPDYDARTSGDNFQQTILRLAPHAVAVAAHEIHNGIDVLYTLAGNPAECRRIAGLSPTSQIVEMGWISKELSKPAVEPKADPENPKPAPVSQSSPPPRSLGGVAPPSPQHKVPTSMEEHKRMKRERAS